LPLRHDAVLSAPERNVLRPAAGDDPAGYGARAGIWIERHDRLAVWLRLLPRAAYLDCTVAAGATFDLVYTARTPYDLSSALAASFNVTLNRFQDIVIAGAAASVALSYLKNEIEAGRQKAKFTSGLERLIDEEDEARTSNGGGQIVPDIYYQQASR
jgi:hypothetical protein